MTTCNVPFVDQKYRGVVRVFGLEEGQHARLGETYKLSATLEPEHRGDGRMLVLPGEIDILIRTEGDQVDMVSEVRRMGPSGRLEPVSIEFSPNQHGNLTFVIDFLHRLRWMGRIEVPIQVD